MYADLDQLVLSGKLFHGADSRSSSPLRTPSPSTSHIWPGDSLEDAGSDYDSDAERAKQIDEILSTNAGPQESIGLGPGRTGVKGVIRDRAEAESRSRKQRASELEQLSRRMERANLGGKTFLEEEREREWERKMLEGLDLGDSSSTILTGGKGKGRFGHLREVGVSSFVAAVEQEARGVWVVVHIYDPSLDRCHTIDTTLSRLARIDTDVKFIRCRAGALGFASTSRKEKNSSLSSTRRPLRAVAEDDDYDPYAYDEQDITDTTESNSADEFDDDDVDRDVLPTLLVYRDGDLVFNWVRVDWEAGRQGIEDLLIKHRILKRAGPGPGNCGLPSDDDDDDDDDDGEVFD